MAHRDAPGRPLSWLCDSRRPHLPDPHLRVPDERARLRAPGGPAGRGGLPARRRRRDPGRGGVQHLRGPRERGRPAVREPGSPAAAEEERHADRGGRLPGPDGAHQDHPARALGRRGVRHAQHGLAARPARAGPGQERGAGRVRRDAGDVPLAAARPAPVRLFRLGLDLGGLQQHLHLLHRAQPARQGAGPPPRRHPGRDPRAGRGRRAGGHAARPERELLRRRVRRPAGVRQAAARLRPDRGPGARPLHLPAPQGLHRRRDRRDGARPRTSCPACTCRCSPARTPC